MPEGDTIFRTATVLRRALVGGVVRRAVAQPGTGTVARARPVGAGGCVRGGGGGAREAPADRLLWWPMAADAHADEGLLAPIPPGRALAAPRPACGLRARDGCGGGGLLRRAGGGAAHRCRTWRATARSLALGPDLLGAAPDLDEAVRRLRERDEVPLGEALLDQRAVAGIGNVIKSEALFMERLDPWAPVRAFSDGELRAVLGTRREAAGCQHRRRTPGDDRSPLAG